MRALSDLSGVDIKHHKNNPEELAFAVREWFVETVGLRGLKSPSKLWYDFNDFMSEFYNKRKSEGFSDRDVEKIPVPEYMDFIREWLANQRIVVQSIPLRMQTQPAIISLTKP